MRERSSIEQGEYSSTGSSNSSHNSGEDTASFFQTPANSGTAINAGNRHNDNYGNADEQSDFEETRSFDRRRKTYASFNEYGMVEASTDLNTFTRSGAQDLSAKCQVCLKEHRVCDQAKPRCSACIKRGRACIPQDNQRPIAYQDQSLNCDRCFRDRLVCDQGRPRCGNCEGRGHACEYQEDILPQPKKISRGIQDSTEKCDHCFATGYWCDGNSPCGTCVHLKVRLCCPQGSKQVNMHDNLVGDRCSACRRDSLRCNGEEPCNTCVEIGRSCYKEKLIPGAIQCMHCISHKIACDGAAPCGTCMRQKLRVCRHLDDDGLIEWHYDTTSTPKDVHCDCLGCVRYERLRVGPVKVPCDRQRPCNNCIVKSHEKNCCYQVEECLQMVIPKGGNTSTGHKRETTKTNIADPGEETCTDDATSEKDSTGDKSDVDDDIYEEGQKSAGPSRARQQGQG